MGVQARFAECTWPKFGAGFRRSRHALVETVPGRPGTPKQVVREGSDLGLGLGWAGLGCWLGWARRALKLKLVYSKMTTLCPDRKHELSNGQQQQAISIYFFLEGL